VTSQHGHLTSKCLTEPRRVVRLGVNGTSNRDVGTSMLIYSRPPLELHWHTCNRSFETRINVLLQKSRPTVGLWTAKRDIQMLAAARFDFRVWLPTAAAALTPPAPWEPVPSVLGPGLCSQEVFWQVIGHGALAAAWNSKSELRGQSQLQEASPISLFWLVTRARRRAVQAKSRHGK